MKRFSKQNRKTFWKYKKKGGGAPGPLGPSPKFAYGNLLDASGIQCFFAASF